MFTMDAFVEALTLEPAGEDRYRATSVPSDYGMVWGGQLLAQSVMGALAGQDGKAVKTLHCVFARPRRPTIHSTSRSTACTAVAR